MSADVTIYRDPAQVNVIVVNGVPPTDQSAQVATLTAALATANAKIAAARTAAQADKDADDAREAGQGVLDALL
jgi:uncharacterized membrane protein